MNALLLYPLLAVTSFAGEPNAVPVAPVEAEMRLGMRKSGDLTQIARDGEIRTIQTFILTVGNPGNEDVRYMGRMSMALGAFSMDSAQYFHNDDSTWRMFNFRMPHQGESDRFIDFLASTAGEAALKDPYARENVGTPDDFVYKKMRIAKKDLPAPLNRATSKGLEPIAGIFRYNADGTMKIYLKEPFDQEENAKKVYWRLKKEIEAR